MSFLPNGTAIKWMGAGFLMLLIAFSFGCRPSDSSTSTLPVAKPLEVTLDAGASVPLILVTELESGQTPVGTTCKFLVSEDVKGSVPEAFIPKGSIIQGEVIRSRRENTLGGLMNQPARLDVHLKGITDTHGNTINFSAESNKDSDIHFDRSNTGEVERITTLSEDSSALELRDLITKDSHLDERTQARVVALCDQLGLSKSASSIKQGEGDRILEFVKNVRSLRSSSGTALTGSAAPIESAVELLGVVGQVGSKVGQMLKGRNIRAHVGTKVIVQTSDPMRATVFR